MMRIDSESAGDVLNKHFARTEFAPDESLLNKAIQNNQIALYFQPQIDLSTGDVVGFEGLLRWIHPEYGVRLPETFIPAAEQTGQIEQLTHLAIDAGFKFIEELSPELSFSLNISDQCIQR